MRGRIVVAPEPFGEQLAAGSAAQAIAAGWQRTCPEHELLIRPLSAGGDGLLAAISAGLGGQRIDVGSGASENAGPGQYLLVGNTAWIAAQPTSAATGELLKAAVTGGAGKVIVGIGPTSDETPRQADSGQADCGAGLLAALGATATGGSLQEGPAELSQIRHLELEPARRLLAGVELVLCTDDERPLLGARGVAPAAGTDSHLAEPAAFAQAVPRRADGRDPAVALGAGAGGGLGFALLALGAKRVPGARTVLAATLEPALRGADLVITGRARLDWRSMANRTLISEIGRLAAPLAIPVIAMTGSLELARSDLVAMGLAAAYPLCEPGEELSSGPVPAQQLEHLAQRLARTWGPVA